MMSTPTLVQFLQATTAEPWMVWAVIMFVPPARGWGWLSRSALQLARRRIDHLCGNEFAQCSRDDVDAAAESARRQLACGNQPIGRCATDSEDGCSPGDSKQQ